MCIRWPEDKDRKVPEKESFTWTVLEPHKWTEEVHLGWRYAQRELAGLAAAPKM